MLMGDVAHVARVHAGARAPMRRLLAGWSAQRHLAGSDFSGFGVNVNVNKEQAIPVKKQQVTLAARHAEPHSADLHPADHRH